MQAGAAAAGGVVHTLMGNHELMLLDGQFHYVAREELFRCHVPPS